jgi:hypothetical protein
LAVRETHLEEPSLEELREDAGAEEASSSRVITFKKETRSREWGEPQLGGLKSWRQREGVDEGRLVLLPDWNPKSWFALSWRISD